MNSKDHVVQQTTIKVKTRTHSTQFETSPSDNNFSYKHIGQTIVNGDIQLLDKNPLHHAKTYERSASALSAFNGKEMITQPDEQLQQLHQNSQKRAASNQSKQKMQLQMINNNNLDRSPSGTRKQDTLMGTLLGNKPSEYSSSRKMSNNHGDSSKKESNAPTRRETVTLTTSQENLYLEKKIKSLENNARYFESQAHPLFVENFNLKDQIIQLTESIKIMTKIIATMVKGKDPTGKSREMVKKIGDFEQLIVCLQEDMAKEQNDNTELQAMNDKLQKDLSCLREDIQVMKATHLKEIQQLREKYEDERSQMESNYKGKISELSGDLSSKIEVLQNQNTKQAADLKDKTEEINNLIPLLEDWKGRATRAQNQLSNMLITFEDEKQAMKIQHSQALLDLQDYQKIQLEKAAQELKKYVQERDAKDDILKQEINERKEEIDYLQRELKESREENEKLNGIIQEKMDNIGQMIKQLKNLEDQGVKQLEIIKSQESQINGLNGDLLKSQRENASRNEEIRNLKEKQEALEQQIQADGRLCEEQQDKYQEQMEAQRIRCNEEINQLKHQHVIDIQEVKLKHDQELKELAERLEKDKKASLDQLESENRKILNSIQERLRDMGNENDKLHEKYEEIIQANNLKSQMELVNYQQNTQKLQDQIDQLLSEKRLEDEVIEQKMKKYIEQIDLLNKEKLEKAEEFERNILRAVSEETARMEGLMVQMEAQWKGKMEELDRDQKLALEKLIQENKSSNELFGQQLANLDKKAKQQLEALKVELNSAQEKLIKDLKAQHDQQLDKLTAEHSQRLLFLEKEWEQKTKLAKSDFNAMINALEEDLQKEQTRIKDLEQNLFDTRRNFENRLLEGQSALLKEKSKLQEQQEKELGDLRVSISSLERIVGELQGQRAELQETKGDLQNRLLILKQQLIDFQRQHTLQLQQVQIDKQVAQAQQKENEELLKKQCQDQISALSLSQLKLLDKLKIEFEEIKVANLNILKLEQEKYSELAKLYNERPSRKEDMKLIKDAQDKIIASKMEVTEAEQKVSSAKQLVKYLQLELENYKNNYDIFGPNQGQSYQHQQSLLKLFRQQDILQQSKVQHDQLVTQQLQMKQPSQIQHHHQQQQQQQQHNQQQLMGLLQQQPSLIMKGSRQLIKQQQEQQKLNPIQMIQQDKDFLEQQKIQQQQQEKQNQYQQSQIITQQEQNKSQLLQQQQNSQQQLQHQHKSHNNHHSNQQNSKQQIQEQFTPWEQQTDNYRTRILEPSSIEIISQDFFGKPSLECLNSKKIPTQQQQQSKDSILQNSRNDVSNNSSFIKNLSSKSRKLVRRRSKTLNDCDGSLTQISQMNNDKDGDKLRNSNFRVFEVNSRNNSAILGNISGNQMSEEANDLINQGLLVSGSKSNGISLRANSNDVPRYANSSSNILPMFLNPFENDNLMRNAEVFVEQLQRKKRSINNNNNLSNISNQKQLSTSKSTSPQKQINDLTAGKANSKDRITLSGKQIKPAESTEEIEGNLLDEKICNSEERLTTQERMFQNSSSSFKKSAGSAGSKKYWRQKSYHNNSGLVQDTIERVDEGFN